MNTVDSRRPRSPCCARMRGIAVDLSTRFVSHDRPESHRCDGLASAPTKLLHLPEGAVREYSFQAASNCRIGALQAHRMARKKSAVVRRAGLAQLVEHLICNQGVGGSSPSAGTIFTLKTLDSESAGLRLTRSSASAHSRARRLSPQRGSAAPERRGLCPATGTAQAQSLGK